ncbi:transposase, partial [Flavobacterium columnare]
LAELNQKMEELIKTAENELIKSITGYEFYIKVFYSIFKI